MTISITPEQLAAKEAVLAQNGIVITGTSGEVNSHGCVIDYTYADPVLALTVRSHPFLAPESLVESKLAAFFA